MRWLWGVALMCLAAATSFAFSAEQAARGKGAYGQHCAVCHGSDGQGGTVPAEFAGLAGWRAPRLIGEGALPEQPPAWHKIRLAPFRTAGDVLTFTGSTMPGQAPGSLEEREYAGVVAYILEANGMKPGGQPLDEERAAQIPLAGLR